MIVMVKIIQNTGSCLQQLIPLIKTQTSKYWYHNLNDYPIFQQGENNDDQWNKQNIIIRNHPNISERGDLIRNNYGRR